MPPVLTPARWDWDAETGPARLDAALENTGLAWLRAPSLVDAAEREPWTVVTRLLGRRPSLVERQPIRAVPGGRSFSSGHMEAPFHSDSQMFRGVPPHVQVMACHRAAARGGEGLYLDTWALLERLAREDGPLFARLFDVPRRFPFVFGDVFGPTVSLRGGSLVFTHSPRPVTRDAVAVDLRPWIEAAAAIEVRAEAGDVVVIHNHRLLHGRRGFEDVGRSFTRVLAWRDAPWPAPVRLVERARDAAQRLDAGLQGAPDGVREAFGMNAPSAPSERLGIVLELLRGVPAGVLSAREGVPEPVLYRWRDAALQAATRGLQEMGEPPAMPDEAQGWLERLRTNEE